MRCLNHVAYVWSSIVVFFSGGSHEGKTSIAEESHEVSAKVFLDMLRLVSDKWQRRSWVCGRIESQDVTFAS